ncbi:hypothetical protein ABTK26_20380, partial [Acinetobacter baumannii]
GIGADAKFTGAAFNPSLKGKVSEPIAATTGVFVVKIDNIGAKASNTDTEAIKQNLLQAQRMALYRGVDALRKDATIKDYRSKFF